MLTLGSSWCSKWNKKLTPCLHAWNHLLYFQVSCQQQLTYVDPVKTFYALNPQNNLPNTQKMFQKWFERYELWNTQIVEQLKEELPQYEELKQRWQQQGWFYKQNSSAHFLVHFDDVHFTNTTWNLVLRTFMARRTEIRDDEFFSSYLRIHLQGNSPTFRSLRKAK